MEIVGRERRREREMREQGIERKQGLRE